MFESIAVSTAAAVIFLISFLVSKKAHTFYKYLLVLYALSFAMSPMLILVTGEPNIKVVPSIYLLICLYLWIYPFKYCHIPKISAVGKTNIGYTFWGLITTIITIYFGFYAIKSILSTPLEIARNILTENSVLPINLLTYLGILVQSIYYINIILFFLSIIQYDDNRMSFLLFVGSFSNVFYVLCFFGRDGIVYWLFNFIVLFTAFSGNIQKDKKSQLLKLSIVVISIILFMFVLITYFRFSANTTNGFQNMLTGVLSYFSQQLGNFSDAYKYDIRTGSLIPQIERFLQQLGFPKWHNDQYYGDIANLQYESNVFGTFIKSFYFIIGKTNTIMLSIIAFFTISAICLSSKSIGSFMIAYTIYQIPLCGLFYYRQSVSYFDLSYVVSIVPSIILRRLF